MDFTKTVRLEKLLRELRATVPSLVVPANPRTAPPPTLFVDTDDAAGRLFLNPPPGANPALLDTLAAVVTAHDPTTPDAAETQALADDDALTAFVAAYADMRTRLATIQTEMDGIKGRADTLAGLPTWSGLTLAATTARLQQVMPPLGQDLSTFATEVRAICVGLDNMLQALAVLRRRQGG